METEPCSVCLCPLSASGGALNLGSCGHTFCSSCLCAWLADQDLRSWACPYCRQKVDAGTVAAVSQLPPQARGRQSYKQRPPSSGASGALAAAVSFLAAASLALREEKTDQGGEVSSSSGGGSSRVLAWAGDRLLPRQAAEAAGTLLVSVSLQGMLHAEKGGALLATVAGAAAGILLGLAFLILALRCGLLALCHACAATASLFGISHASECAHVSSSNAALWIIVPLEVAGTCLYLALSMSDSHPFPSCSRLLQQLRHTDRGTLARFLLHLNIRGLLFAACILLTAFAVNLALVACTWLVLPAAH